MANLCRLYIFLLIWCINSCEGIINLPENIKIQAVFAFGDSLVDQGNNNLLPTLSKCNFPPYGNDFEYRKPTGRFCNGKTIPDLIAEEFGVKSLVPAYLDPHLNCSDLVTGVSFASGGSGLDPLTTKLASTLSVFHQLELFKEYIEKVKSIVGEERTNDILTNSIFIMFDGNNDIASYFNVGVRRIHFHDNVGSYADLLVALASNFIQEIYKLGARKIAVHSVIPVGCLPGERTLLGGLKRECVEKVNQGVTIINDKLSYEVESLNQRLPGSKVAFIDTFNPILDIIQNPLQYGFEIVDKGCCGTGTIEASVLCNELSGTCLNVSAYLFWDCAHLTEKGYKILVNKISPKYATSFF